MWFFSITMKLFNNDMLTERYEVLQQELRLPSFRTAVEAKLVDYPNAWWIGLDFKNEPIQQDAVSMAFGWLHHNARVFGAHLVPFISVEPIFSGKRASVHIILLCDLHININDLRRGWKFGHSYVRVYNHSLGGVEYTYTGHKAVHTRMICGGAKPCRKTRKGKILCAKDTKRDLTF
jgi:hypothetical protein